jgi:hypothetical protein
MPKIRFAAAKSCFLIVRALLITLRKRFFWSIDGVKEANVLLSKARKPMKKMVD